MIIYKVKGTNIADLSDLEVKFCKGNVLVVRRALFSVRRLLLMLDKHLTLRLSQFG